MISPDRSDRPRPLPALTSLRFFLACWVILLHGADYLESWLGTGPSWEMNFVRTGYQGVNVFFVLSGFVLAYNYAAVPMSGSDLRGFLWSRFVRIYPVYLFATLFFLPIGVYKLGLAGSLLPLVLSLSLLQSWVPDYAVTWNPPSWSLSCEAFFYAAFPTVVILLRRVSWRSGLSLTAMVGVLWIIGLIVPLWATTADIPGFSNLPAATRAQEEISSTLANFVRFNPLVRLPEFIVGVVCGLHFVQRRQTDSIQRGTWLATTGALGLFLASAVASPFVPLPLVHNGLWMPCTVLLGLAEHSPRWLSSPWLVRLGHASYAMYLLHWPIRSVLRFAEQKFLAPNRMPESPGWMIFVFLGLSIVAGLVAYQWIEIPARRWLARKSASDGNLPPSSPS